MPEITRQINNRDADSLRDKQDNSEQAPTISVVGRNWTDADEKSEEEPALPVSILSVNRVSEHGLG